MAVDSDKPDQGKPADEAAKDPAGVVVPADSSGTPPPSAIPAGGELAGADAEKAAMVEQAKARVAAVKDSLAEKAAPPSAGAPKAPVKKKEEGPKPVDASENKLVKKLKGRFAGAMSEPLEFLGQVAVRVAAASIVEVCTFLRDDQDARFNYLSDLTCV